jgi:uncharacterized membrane protein
MTATETSTVVGIFEDQKHAAEAIRALRQAGFTREQIGLAAREWAEAYADVRVDLQHQADEGAVAGAVAGGAAGVLAGVAGVALIPGVGPVLVGTLVAGALLGGGLGAAVGTFAGPFVAMGMKESDAVRHAHHLEKGNTVVVVHTSDRNEEARHLLIQHGAYDDTMSNSP